MPPPALDKTDLGRLGGQKVGDCAEKERGVGTEIGVKDRDELPSGGRQGVGQCTRLIAAAVATPHHFDLKALCLPASSTVLHHPHRVVGRIVQNLKLKLIDRILETRTGIDQSGRHMSFVKNGQLHGDRRPERGRIWLGG